MPVRDSETRKKMPGQERPHVLLFWWIASLLLFFRYLSSLWPHSQSRAQIPYSAFLGQLEDGNVARVHIAGDTIEDEFSKGVLWPPAEAASAPTPPSAPTTPAKSAPPNPPPKRPQTEPRVANREFSTTFPATVGDLG